MKGQRFVGLLAGLLLLTACYEEGPRICPNGPNEPTADTLIGARVDGRSVLIPHGSAGSSAFYYPSDQREYLYVVGWRLDDFPPQLVELMFAGFHGVGSYPVGNFSGPGTAFAITACGYNWTNDADAVSYWPQEQGMEGDSVWVSEWDSVSGRLRGTFSYHSTDTEGDLVPITDGTFDVIVRK